MLTTQTKFYGFNYDKMFKAIFIGPKKERTHLLCELLSECLKIKIDKILKFIPVELSIRQKKERYKRLDLLLEADGRKINLELNSSYSESTRIRNLNYYFSFCSQQAVAGDAYDTESDFIHISLNYNVDDNTPLIKCYTLYDKSHNIEFDSRFKYYEINVEKFAKLWYDNDIESARKNPLLTMIGIKDEKELEKYSIEMDNSSIKESVDSLKRLNSDAAFVYDITPEEDEILIKNTIKKLARKEGLAEGRAEGIAEGRAEGRAEGIAEGFAEGAEDTKRIIAINMIKANISIEQISNLTGLAENEIKKIEKEI